MGKITCFVIILTDNKSVYHPGELVTGQCIVELKDKMSMRALRMSINGAARVEWTEARDVSSHNHIRPTRVNIDENRITDTYSAEVNYFKQRLVLFGQETSGGDKTLSAGRHEFNFSFELPRDGIPTSFKGTDGNIKYWLKARVDKTWPMGSTIEQEFTVISPVFDINEAANLRPVGISAEKTVGCLCCISGPVSVTARADKQGYCASGSALAISAEFENYSNDIVTPTATLCQRISFIASEKTRTSKKTFTVIGGAPVAPSARDSWNAKLLNIPDVPPTNVICSIIKVEYYVQVRLQIPNAIDLNTKLPIIIGTAPDNPPAYYTLNAPQQTVEPYNAQNMYNNYIES